HPKALPSDDVAQATRGLGLATETTATVEEALARGLQVAREQGAVLLATGSLFVAAGVRVAFTGQPWWQAPLYALDAAQTGAGLV
ncbi:MAG: hypothetical protein GXO36_03525, partial [Chloroflexi bacterium]|nr:hypothetical protein [Chloroflexota bacterium]